MTDDTPTHDDGGGGEFSVDTSLEDSDSTGARMGDALARQARLFWQNILLFVMRLMPMSQKFWRGLHQMALTGLHKSAGGDAINYVMDQGRVRPEPVKFDRAGSDSPVNDPRWIDQHGNYWKSPDEAESTYLMGKVPVVWSSSRANELGSHVQAEVAEALDLGEEYSLYESANVRHVKVDAELPAGGSSAVADGGHAAQQWDSRITVDDTGSLSDVVVDLNRGLSAGDEGRVVSLSKYYDTYPSTPGSEEMQTQFMLGQLAEKDHGEKLNFAMKVLLVALGIIAVVELGPPLIGALLGGAGGGSSAPILGLLPVAGRKLGGG